CVWPAKKRRRILLRISNFSSPRGQKGYAMEKLNGLFGGIPGGEEAGVVAVSVCGEQTARSVLDRLVHEGAQRMLQAALEAEVQNFVQRFQSLRDERGQQRVVRNGYLPERTILTGAGEIEVRQPRVRD